MSETLAGKTAVVTGASRGIGLAIARALAERGARVAMLARGASRLESAAESVGGGALVVPADVSQPDSVRAAFAAVEEAFGRLDVLVNNAAVARLHRLEDARDEDLHAEIATNFLGVLYCTRAAIPMLRTAGGTVVNLSSEGVRRPFPGLSVYLATKGAVETLSSALKEELRPEGVRVTLLRSGGSTGGFAEEWDPEQAQKAIASWNEQKLLDFVGLPMAPESIAAAVIHAVTAPADASIDFLEIRSARAVPRPRGDE